MTIHVWGKPEVRDVRMCRPCAASWKTEVPTAHVHAEKVLPAPALPADEPASEAVASLRRGLAAAQRAADRARAAREALPPGSSRARVTTANARWMIYTETRDKFAQRLYELTGEIE